MPNGHRLSGCDYDSRQTDSSHGEAGRSGRRGHGPPRLTSRLPGIAIPLPHSLQRYSQRLTAYRLYRSHDNNSFHSVDSAEYVLPGDVIAQAAADLKETWLAAAVRLPAVPATS